jgi:hypothetical protein
MKKFFTLRYAAIFLVALTVALAAPSASAQSESTRLGSFSGLPASIAATTTTNVASSITLWQGRGIAIQPVFAGTAAATDNVVLTFRMSVDGTNYSTTGVTVTNALNGTNVVRGFHVLTPEQVLGARRLQLYSIASAGTNSLTLTGVLFSQPN